MTESKDAGVLTQIPFGRLATDLAEWASASGNVGQVATFYELASGAETTGYSFNGLDEAIIKQALNILQDRGQAEIIGDDGVKFL